MAQKHDRMKLAVVGLGEQAVLSGQMGYEDAALGSFIATLHLLVKGGKSAEEALASIKTVTAKFEADLQPKRPPSRPPGYVNIAGREYGGGDGPLSGHRIVFTGSMGMPRQEAAALAAGLGAQCSDSVSMKTTILVIGNGDGASRAADLGYGIRMTIAAPKSGKQAKAEKLIAEGAAIRIMDEVEFLALCNSAENEVE